MGYVLVKQVDILDAKLQRLQEQHNSIKECTASRSGEVTLVEAATSCGKSKTLKNAERKERRRRMKSKLQVHRSLLLRMRPVAELCDNVQRRVSEDVSCGSNSALEKTSACLVDQGVSVNLAEKTRLRTHDHHCGIPAVVLARQCQAARILQRSWRRRVIKCKTTGTDSCESRGMDSFCLTSGIESRAQTLDELIYFERGRPMLQSYTFTRSSSAITAGSSRNLESSPRQQTRVYQEPRLPPAAYFLYMRACTEKGMSLEELKVAQQSWATLDPAEKRIFESEAQHMRIQYDTQRSEFRQHGFYHNCQ